MTFWSDFYNFVIMLAVFFCLFFFPQKYLPLLPKKVTRPVGQTVQFFHSSLMNIYL